MLWEIAHKALSKPSYLFGTYHSRDNEINDLPPKVMQTLQDTETLYTETAITQKSYNEIQNFMQDATLLPLRKRLSSSTYRRLQQHMGHSKLPLDEQTLSAYKTWAIALLLTNHAESKTHSQALFMDERFVKSAKDLSLPSKGLETPKEQLVFFDMLSPQEQEYLLIDSIKQLDDEQYTQALKAWYIQGDIKGFNALQETFQDNDPHILALDEKLLYALLTERNIRFMKRIHLILQEHPHKNYFFAVGVGHLAEENGLISLLRKKGYRLKKVK